MPVNERSIAGLFLAMQYPQEIPGVTNSDFLRAAMNVRREEPISLFKFIKAMEGTISDLQMKEDLAHRFLNEGFSGGEKKRNEIVQMEMLKPSFAMLDEIDSGLDVDALHIVADALNKLHEEDGMAMLVVSHYERFYQLIKPQFTHVLVNGKIVLEGDSELADKIDQEGYDWIYKQYDVQPAAAEEEKRPAASIGSCAVRTAAEAKK
jgi:Fe-S cluster assembly ATP-binding protein